MLPHGSQILLTAGPVLSLRAQVARTGGSVPWGFSKSRGGPGSERRWNSSPGSPLGEEEVGQDGA